MEHALATALNRLDRDPLASLPVLRWGSPVPAFGDPEGSWVATVGLNPSNREFVDEDGKELRGTQRRFHTLASLGLLAWHQADAYHLQLLVSSCTEYFRNNPYDRWFRRLDDIIAAAGFSYYSKTRRACHLDLVPYSTAVKWSSLSGRDRMQLLAASADILGLVLHDSRIRALILNGSTVVRYFQRTLGIELRARPMSAWDMPRSDGSVVRGVAYTGCLDAIGGCRLPTRLIVLGYNHNIQSSYGVSRSLVERIGSWIKRRLEDIVP